MLLVLHTLCSRPSTSIVRSSQTLAILANLSSGANISHLIAALSLRGFANLEPVEPSVLNFTCILSAHIVLGYALALPVFLCVQAPLGEIFRRSSLARLLACKSMLQSCFLVLTHAHLVLHHGALKLLELCVSVRHGLNHGMISQSDTVEEDVVEPDAASLGRKRVPMMDFAPGWGCASCFDGFENANQRFIPIRCHLVRVSSWTAVSTTALFLSGVMVQQNFRMGAVRSPEREC
eukprot:6195001-Amphidinium_carterae.1